MSGECQLAQCLQLQKKANNKIKIILGTCSLMLIKSLTTIELYQVRREHPYSRSAVYKLTRRYQLIIINLHL
jgi:hypothetical protein